MTAKPDATGGGRRSPSDHPRPLASGYRNPSAWWDAVNEWQGRPRDAKIEAAGLPSLMEVWMEQ